MVKTSKHDKKLIKANNDQTKISKVSNDKIDKHMIRQNKTKQSTQTCND